MRRNLPISKTRDPSSSGAKRDRSRRRIKLPAKKPEKGKSTTLTVYNFKGTSYSNKIKD
jgi:hypothetical protein